MASLEQLVAEITKIVTERLELQMDPSELSADSHLMDDLGLDSAAILDVVVGIEETFGVDFDIAGTSEDDFQSIRALARYVQTRIS
jgi:acyl carrier protein